jgi:hypothetical protein
MSCEAALDARHSIGQGLFCGRLQVFFLVRLAVGLTSDKTVASVRAELVARSEIPSVDDRMDFQ